MATEFYRKDKPPLLAQREAEALCREFARVHPTPNVRHGVELCESGRLDWVDVAALFAKSYGEAKREVG